MKILILSHKPPYPIIDGACRAMDRLLRDVRRAFPDSKIDYVSIATHKHPGSTGKIPEELSDRVSFRKEHISTKINPISALFYLITRKSYHFERFRKKALKHVILPLLSENDYDIVLFESLFAGGFIDEIKAAATAKLIYRAHNIEHKIWRDLAQGETNPLKKWYLKDLSRTLKKAELEFLEKTDLVFSISSLDQLYFEQHTSTKSVYLPVSVLTEPGQNKVHNSLCFLGAFNWKPNKEGIHWFAEHIFTELRSSIPELRLEIAGSFSEEIAFLSKKENIRLHGFVESSKEFIRHNGIFIAPLLSGSGIKMKVLEAMSLGVPCVVSKKAAEGMNLPPEIPICADKKEFIEKLFLVLKDEELKERIGAAGLAYIQKEYSDELISEKIGVSIRTLLR